MSGSDLGPADKSDVVSGDGLTSAKPQGPRPKKARKAKAIAAGDVLGAGGTEVIAELAGLKDTMDRLEQGLREMLVIQGTHTEMVRQLMVVMTVPAEPEQHATRWLEHVAGLLVEHGVTLKGIGTTLNNLPAAVGSAVATEVISALDKAE